MARRRKRQSRPAAVIRSVTFLLSSFDGSTFGAWRSFSGTSFGFESAPTPTAYSNEVPVLQDLLAALAGDPFQEGLGLLGVLARGEHAAAGDADEGARILVA